MKKCPMCNNIIKTEDIYCSICQTHEEGIVEKILRIISSLYTCISLTLFPITCFVIIIYSDNFVDFFNSDDFIFFLILLFSFLHSVYYTEYLDGYFRNLQGRYKLLLNQFSLKNKE